ncbi:hypothetical protein ONZ51_g5453 [Trametes cubensis]|uniref:Uncharacterized protein n=1 Tax=Trametes cubensis TaxID=1111947 RepID=A0AAD7X9D5_9APHY|nr:hypothetical protein ONZ51_g5453 [Trametes cubensis]
MNSTLAARRILAARVASTPRHLSRASFSSTARLYAAASEAQNKAGEIPSYGPVGVARALQADPSTPAKPTLFTNEFSLAGRVALVSGANRGLGLEMALALTEAGARAVYCVDLPKEPGAEWTAVRDHARRMEGLPEDGGRLEYLSADVRDQDAMWKLGETIGEREGRMDVCVAAAGILKSHTDCLEYPAKQFQEVSVVPGRRRACMDYVDVEMWKSATVAAAAAVVGAVAAAVGAVGRGIIFHMPYGIGLRSRRSYELRGEVMDVNVNGVLFTAQAAGRQMARFGNGGSIILIASMSGSITNKDHAWVSYNTSKSAVLQMGRSMACELGPKRIRVNTLSPGHIYTKYVHRVLSCPFLYDSAVVFEFWCSALHAAVVVVVFLALWQRRILRRAAVVSCTARAPIERKHAAEEVVERQR